MTKKQLQKKVKRQPRKLGDVMPEDLRAQFPRVAALTPGMEAWEFLTTKLGPDQDLSQMTAGLVAELSIGDLSSMLESGPQAKKRKAEEQKKMAPEWQATADAEWRRQRQNEETLSTIGQMTRFIRKGLLVDEKQKPSLTMIERAIQGRKPTAGGRKRRGALARNRPE